TGEGVHVIRLGAVPLVLHIVASADGRGNDLSLGQGYDPAVLRLRPGSIRLDFGPDLAAIHLENVDPLDVLGGPRSIGTLRFADGRVMTYDELVRRGFDIDGSSADDVLQGSNLVDRIAGHAGDDTLDGRAGDDLLFGGRGDDVYLVRRDEGRDAIYDVRGNDTLRFLDGIGLDDLAFGRAGKDLRISIAGGGEVRLRGHYSTSNLAIEQLALADGSTWALRALVNEAPFVRTPLAPLPVVRGAAFEHALARTTFFDRDGDRLHYTLTRADGGALPAWLDFDATTFTLSGQLPRTQWKPVRLALSADDGHARVSTDLVLDPRRPPATLPPPIAMAVPLVGTAVADIALVATAAPAGEDARLLTDAMATFGAAGGLSAAHPTPPPEAALPPLAADWSHAA
ncbi:MAG: calcium-binding protein, partial [Gammaproteobacteria bacterium]